MGQSLDEKNVEDDAQKVAAQVQLQKYGAFFDGYQRSLERIAASLRHKWNFPRKRYLRLEVGADERIESIHDLINSENKIIDKVVAIFCRLCAEVAFIERTAKREFVDVIGCYGDGLPEEAPYEDCQLRISQMLPTLQRLSDFVIHCERVLNDILSQLSGFYSLHFEITDCNLRTVFDAIADLLLTLLVLQETLANNQTLLYHWTLYRRTIQLATQKTIAFTQQPQRIRQLSKLADRLETQLLSGRIFETALNSNLERKVAVKQNKRLEEELNGYLKQMYAELETLLTRQNCTDMTKVMKLCVAFALHVNIFGSYERKLLKGIGDVCKRIPLITLGSNVSLSLDTFFSKHVAPFLKSSERKMFDRELEKCATACLADVTQSMNRDVQHYVSHVLSWTLQLEARLDSRCVNGRPLTSDHLEEVCRLLMDGVSVSRQLKALLTTVSNLHVTVDRPMFKTSAISFCKLVELIRCVDAVFARHHDTLLKTVNHALQYMQYQCLSILRACKQPATAGGGAASEKRFKEINVDALSSLVIAEYCLCGPPSADRLNAVHICLNIASHAKCLGEPDRQKLRQLLQKISTISSLMPILEEVSACNFMYWNRSTLPLYLEEVERKQMNVNRVQHMFDAFENSVELRLKIENGRENEIDYGQSTIAALCDEFLRYITEPICRKMEENLRLHVLSYLQPCTTLNYELNAFARAEPLTLIGGKRLDLQYQVETYLDRTFYDLTTVALHDWQTYGEMRTLAAHKFGRRMVDDGLPNHTLEQGPDLLETTRAIHTFVANHFYNLNNQIFIEASSNNKHVNVINIRHTANSIRTHGAGITSTAVNYAYQFLRTKLNLISQLLYDEQIKSRLLKEVTAFDEQQSPNVKYPYERADRLYRGIRQLAAKAGPAPAEGVDTYVDQFRTVVTHIGNALGYVRLIRSGSLRYFSDAIGFVPDLNRAVDMDALCPDAFNASECAQAARNWTNVVSNMCHNIAEGSNYFKLLVDVFANVTQEPSNDHLRYFYAIVPVLSIHFIEYIITAKEGLSKKASHKTTRVTFTDDGFAMGVVYLLHTFQQYTKFEALQWFLSVEERNVAVRRKLETQIAATPKDDTKLNHTLSLSLKRLDVFQQEFRHLHYNINSAQVLFRSYNEYNNDDIQD